MVEDGIAIIKVGPALTFAMREALFALAHIEDELIDDPEKRSNFIKVLDEVMVENPKSWKKYYFGSEKDVALDRKYSFSDRCRYLPEDLLRLFIISLFKGGQNNIYTKIRQNSAEPSNKFNREIPILFDTDPSCKAHGKYMIRSDLLSF